MNVCFCALAGEKELGASVAEAVGVFSRTKPANKDTNGKLRIESQFNGRLHHSHAAWTSVLKKATQLQQTSRICVHSSARDWQQRSRPGASFSAKRNLSQRDLQSSRSEGSCSYISLLCTNEFQNPHRGQDNAYVLLIFAGFLCLSALIGQLFRSNSARMMQKEIHSPLL